MALERENNFVADVNAWISFFHANKFKRILPLLAELNIHLHSSPELIKEFKKVYHDVEVKNKKLLPLSFHEYFEAIEAACYIHEPTSHYRLLIDYKDNYLVDLCTDTNSTLISNDRGFEFFKKFKLPPLNVISVKEFYKAIGL